MADEEEFKYDPEAGERVKKLRLPFALCKKYGIPIQDWWTPRDAWNALRRGGEVEDVSEEYADYYRKLKRKRQEEFRKRHPLRVAATRERAATKKRQLADARHNPDLGYEHKDGEIDGAKKGEPMTFEQADSGNVNPFFGEQDKNGQSWIGYRTNCATCVATYVARRKGYDTRALPNLNNKSVFDLSYNVSLAYVDENGKTPERKKLKYDEDFSTLAAEMKPGELYAVSFMYQGRSSGHIVTIEKEASGRAFVYDPQINKRYDISELRSYSRGKYDFKVMNLTNVTMNESFCDGIMKRSK